MLFDALVYIVYVMERYCFPVVCTLNNEAINKFEVKVDVQKGTLKINDRCVGFIEFTFPYINRPQTLLCPFLLEFFSKLGQSGFRV